MTGVLFYDDSFAGFVGWSDETVSAKSDMRAPKLHWLMVSMKHQVTERLLWWLKYYVVLQHCTDCDLGGHEKYLHLKLNVLNNNKNLNGDCIHPRVRETYSAPGFPQAV